MHQNLNTNPGWIKVKEKVKLNSLASEVSCHLSSRHYGIQQQVSNQHQYLKGTSLNVITSTTKNIKSFKECSHTPTYKIKTKHKFLNKYGTIIFLCIIMWTQATLPLCKMMINCHIKNMILSYSIYTSCTVKQCYYLCYKHKQPLLMQPTFRLRVFLYDWYRTMAGIDVLQATTKCILCLYILISKATSFLSIALLPLQTVKIKKAQ